MARSLAMSPPSGLPVVSLPQTATRLIGFHCGHWLPSLASPLLLATGLGCLPLVLTGPAHALPPIARDDSTPQILPPQLATPAALPWEIQPSPSPSGEDFDPSPATDQAPTAPLPERALPPPAAPPLELELTANRQSYDSQRRRFVATGNVMARVAGGRVMADRIEFDTGSRTIYATGSVRFQRGQQYLQASRLRYSLLEGVGEIRDVYGILDLDGTEQDFDLESTPSVPLPAPEPLSCPQEIPPPPQWHPYPWAFTAWGGQSFHSDFGQTFTVQGVFRPEYLAGLGVQRRLLQSGPFSIDLDVNWLNHWAKAQRGGRYIGPFSGRDVANLSTDAQYFSEFTAGLMLRAWIRPWLNIGFEEGVSLLTNLSNYESTYREESARFLNYLAVEVEALFTPEWSVVGRIHHRSGAFGFYNDVTEGSNAYLIGLRYRTGDSRTPPGGAELSPPTGCPGAVPPEQTDPPDGLAEQLEQVTMGPGTITPGPEPSSPAKAPPTSAGGRKEPTTRGDELWARARAQQRARREAIARIDQRVDNVAFQQSLTAERRFGVSEENTDVAAFSNYGAIRPNQLRDLDLNQNKELVEGTISRWRFQAGRLRISPNTLTGDRVAFTNDPFTPAQSWLDSEDVVITLKPNGDTEVKAGRNLLKLEDQLVIPVTRQTEFKKEEKVTNRWVLGFDEEDRDGLYVGYNIPIRIGEKGRLTIQPQFNLERAYQDETDSYPLPGEPAGSSPQNQPITGGDLFGLFARLETPLAGFQATANLDISTFNADNIAEGTRSWGNLGRVLDLPLIGNSVFRFFGAYRFRVWNGSLGEQDIYSAYGISLEDVDQLPNWGKLSSDYYWRVGVGYFRASPFQDAGLTSLWRGNAFGSLNMSYPLWKGEPAELSADQAYANTARPIIPGLVMRANLQGTLTYFGDGTNQNTLTLSAGPTLTLGHFVKPFLDYTELTVTGGGTLRQGLSAFTFDRAVDLGTLGVGLTQQLAGPLVFSGGIGFNVDPASEFYGEVTDSYVELRWQRRAYEIGVYYSPYDGLGGVRVKLNDFNFDGTGAPFVPYRPRTGYGPYDPRAGGPQRPY